MDISPTTTAIPVWVPAPVPATSVADFLEKYCKPDRYRGRGEEYAKTVLESHEHATRAYGYDIISRHESVTGEAVYWYPAQS